MQRSELTKMLVDTRRRLLTHQLGVVAFLLTNTFPRILAGQVS
jgi:hypothetical protein